MHGRRRNSILAWQQVTAKDWNTFVVGFVSFVTNYEVWNVGVTVALWTVICSGLWCIHNLLLWPCLTYCTPCWCIFCIGDFIAVCFGGGRLLVATAVFWSTVLFLSIHDFWLHNYITWTFCLCSEKVKVKVIPRQAKVAQGVLGRLRPWIFLMFSITRLVGRQPYAPASFTPGEIPGTHFQRLSRPHGTWFRREPRKNPQWHHRESIPGPSDSSAVP